MSDLDYLIEELLKESNNSLDYKQLNIEEKKNLYRALRNIRDPKPISKEYLIKQDEYLKEEIKLKGITDEKDIPFNKDIISIWQGDITTLKCDAIVNACNEYLLGCFMPNHSCIDNAIHSFAGMQLRDECNKIMKGRILPNGHVVLTNGYNLPCKYIIQTVGPQVRLSPSIKDKLDLKNCYLNSLILAKKNNLSTIAFPCISTGVYGYPQKDACKVALKTINDYLKDNPNFFKHIIFNVFKDEDLKYYMKEINND